MALALAWAALLAVPAGVAEAGPAALAQPVVLLGGLGVALACSLVPYSVDLEALRRIPASVYGVLMSLEPAVAALAGLVVLGETLDGGQWMGIGCVVLASIGVTWTRQAYRCR
ncbi:MAG: EamA family transporter [Streptosporangiaceae bacterium]